MNKKYTIINSNTDPEKICIDYIFYIVIFILLIYLICLVLSNKYRDNFNNISEFFSGNVTTPKISNAQAVSNQQPNLNKPPATTVPTVPTVPVSPTLSVVQQQEQKPTIEQLYQLLKSDNAVLKDSKSYLENTLKKKDKAIYLSKYYNKVDEKSFNNEVDYINSYFANTVLPTSDFKDKRLIVDQNELNNVINEVKTYKNIYKVGDIVTQKSSINIDKDKICYADHEDKIAADPDFKKKYPDCMVCSVNPESTYKFTKSYKNTNTNIHKVCLFNQNAAPNSDILNYDGCKKVCDISV